MLVSIALALVAAGLAYYLNGPRVVSGLVGLAALVCFLVAIIAGWRDRFRPQPKATWGRTPYVEIRPISRNPFSAIASQMRIWRLRMIYRRSQRHDGLS